MREFFNITFYVLLVSLFIATSITAQPREAWALFYGGPGDEEFVDVYATSDSGYVMTGRTSSRVDSIIARSDLWIVKVNREGGLEWQRGYDLFVRNDRDLGSSIIETDDGGFLVGGIHRQRDFIAIKVTVDGQLEWERVFGGGAISWCNAVIETKGDTYLLGGTIRGEEGYQGYAVMVDRDGEVIWERMYDREQSSSINAIRESPGNGFLLAGSQIGAFSLLNVDGDGEVIWSRLYGLGENFRGSAKCLVSVDQGYALAGSAIWNNNMEGDFHMVKVDRDGEVLWENRFEMEGDQLCYGMDRMWDGGFFLDGQSGDRSLMLRVSPDGNVIWEFILGRRGLQLFSCVVDREMSLLVAGTCNDPLGRLEAQGILMKHIPEHSPPLIISHTPEELEFYTLPDNEIEFSVFAIDLQDDALNYSWLINDEEIATDSSVVIPFEELGDVNIHCEVSDGELTTGIDWLVHVSEFYIHSHTPDTLDLIVRRGTEVTFALDVAAIEEIEVENLWTLTHRDQRQEEIGVTDTIVVPFELSGDHRLQASVSHENDNHEVNWNILVQSVLWYWNPRDFEITVYTDSTTEFEVFPFNPESDSLDYIWSLDDELLDIDSSFIGLAIPEARLYEVKSIVQDGSEVDTISWTVNVEEWSFTADGADLTNLPTSPVLYPACPNPFNSSVKLSIYLPNADHVLLSVFDINGREVSRLVDGKVQAGNKTIVWYAGDYPAGVYVVRMCARGVSEMRKVVLVR